jgi:hypothetical protein
MVLLPESGIDERVEVASCVPRVGKPQRWDLRGPKIDLQWILNELLDEEKSVLVCLAPVSRCTMRHE